MPQFGFKVNDQGHFSGSTITYKCDPGYTLHGSGVLKCMTGERRAWDNPLPSCIGKTVQESSNCVERMYSMYFEAGSKSQMGIIRTNTVLKGEVCCLFDTSGT